MVVIREATEGFATTEATNAKNAAQTFATAAIAAQHVVDNGSYVQATYTMSR